jgi:diketogulonate reductase-like aldo/keto reductase
LEYKEIKGIRLPVLGIGTWGLGGKHTADYSDDATAVLSISQAIESGFTLIDTAAYYGAGHAEEIVGRAIALYNRDDLFIITKVYRTDLHYDKFISSVRNSLLRMKIKYADLVLVHWPSSVVPVSETMRALESCVDKGLTRFIGVSNFSVDLLQEAQSYLKHHRLVADQVYYNVSRFKKTYFNGLSVSALHSFCKDNDILLIAWSPLEEGKLAIPGRYPVLDELAQKYGKTPAQISLNWLISQDNIVAIPKAVNIDHIKENLGALGWRLSSADFKKLGESF